MTVKYNTLAEREVNCTSDTCAYCYPIGDEPGVDVLPDGSGVSLLRYEGGVRIVVVAKTDGKPASARAIADSRVILRRAVRLLVGLKP